MTNKIYLFDKANLTKTEAKTPLKDGWGVTQTGNTSALVVSDGSDRLYWLDPVTLEVQRTLQVLSLSTRAAVHNDVVIAGW